ncbi:MAG: rhodanese [Pseudohongiella sp.]|nr:MAG: rhodanese [Pseudohongiella sp.]
MQLTKGYKQLVAEAEQQIRSIDSEQLKARLSSIDEALVLIDLRDVREVKREGKIPGSLHIPRGMLEFWIDPESPYYRSEFDRAEELILYCNKGWRSALSAQALLNMGLKNVAHLQGGMEQWQKDGGEVESN